MKTKSTVAFRGVLLAAIAVIAMIGAAEASLADACGGGDGVFKHFDRSRRGEPAPDRPFYLDGELEQSLRGRHGRPLVVNFWATWCAPCVKEMPALDRLAGQVAADGIEVLALSSDRDGAPLVRQFYAKNDIRRLEVLIDRMTAVGRALGIGGLPTTVLLDGEGREVGRVPGIAEWDADATITFLRRCLKPEGGLKEAGKRGG